MAVHDLATETAFEGACAGVYLRGRAALSILWDAEGNASTVVNRSGTSLTGTDYAGYISLDPGGARLAYTNQWNSPSPHVAFELVVRDVASGAEVGRWTTERAVTNLEYDGRWIVATVVDTDFIQVGLLALDTASGGQRYVETSTALRLPAP